MGKRIQIPGHEKTHFVEPGTGRRIFKPLNKTADGPLKMIFAYGVCYIPDPEIATDPEFRAAGFGSKEAAKAVLDYAMDKENGIYGIQYEIDPNDGDGYWKKVGELVENPKIVKEFIGKEKAAKMQKAMNSLETAGKAKSSEAGSGASEAVAEVINSSKRPTGRPQVITGAKGVND